MQRIVDVLIMTYEIAFSRLLQIRNSIRNATIAEFFFTFSRVHLPLFFPDVGVMLYATVNNLRTYDFRSVDQ